MNLNESTEFKLTADSTLYISDAAPLSQDDVALATLLGHGEELGYGDDAFIMVAQPALVGVLDEDIPEVVFDEVPAWQYGNSGITYYQDVYGVDHWIHYPNGYAEEYTGEGPIVSAQEAQDMGLFG